MDAPVQHHAAAGHGVLPPALRDAAGSGHAGLDLKHLAEKTGFRLLPHGQIIGVGAAVLVDGEQAAGAFRSIHHVLQLSAGHGHRLLAHDGFPGLQRLAYQGFMEVVGGGHHDDVQARVGQHRLVGIIELFKAFRLRQLHPLGIDVVHADEFHPVGFADPFEVPMAHPAVADESRFILFHVTMSFPIAGILFSRRGSAHAHHIWAGCSVIITSCRKRIAFSSPCLTDIRPSSCSMLTEPSYPIIRRVDIMSFHRAVSEP